MQPQRNLTSLMKTLIVKVKSEQAAQILADFLSTIDYVEAVERRDLSPVIVSHDLLNGMEPGEYASGEKPSDFAGIWKGRKGVDSKGLRKRAWERQKNKH